MENWPDREILDELGEILAWAKTRNIFANCSLSYAKKCHNRWFRENLYLGTDGFCTEDLLYDLASLTKPLVTSLCLLSLHENRIIDVHRPLSEFVSWRLPEHLKNCSVRDVMEHRSGLPAHREFFHELSGIPVHARKTAVLKRILEEKCEGGKLEIYSDLGYILLGYLVEEISGISLSEYWRKEVIKLSGLSGEDIFFPSAESCNRKYAVTGHCGWSGRLLKGLVHDDNCRSLGGICGHAGLFGSSSAVLHLVQAVVDGISGSPPKKIPGIDIVREGIEQRKGNRWVYGFDTPSARNSSSGEYFSQKSIGHLGFTGTSFWADMERSIIVVMLTDRVINGDELAGIQWLRPAVHNTIMKKLARL